MSPQPDIIGIVKELQGMVEETSPDSFGSPATQGEIAAYEESVERVLSNFPAIAEALIIAVGSLESIWATEYACKLCAGEQRCTMHQTAREALFHIHSLKTND